MNNFGKHSIIRELEYREIAKLDLDGDILDLGGSKKSGYQELIRGSHKIDTANINPDYGCDLIFDIQKRFPINDSAYDHVICFNVLEHIYGFHNVFAETARILKEGGKFIFATPFIHHVHGSPGDYFRYTNSALSRLLDDSGFSVEEIKPLGYGLFSIIFQTIGGSIRPGFLRTFIKKVFIFFDKALSLFKSYKKLREKVPLGYFVIARKN
ncbi:MAG TPA: methyltransferase domain-containing protein [Candidatus Paceibacterota bacterium]|nr:methyltransferase domain-containing protein [Candidatus Paceibacterota bacterium]HRZ34699.1 methyltransferase domain-containing protein [Candidatus Paceibacterota bacterium]